jgi:hypothetical protein
MFFELGTSTEQCANELSLKCTADALEFPRNRTDTQPPPATAFRDAMYCEEPAGTAATTLFSTMLQPLTLTFRISKAATAPPHVEHGSLDRNGHPMSPPIAALRVKLLFRTSRNRSPPPPVAATAPPLAALQLTKLQFDTVTLLSTADTAPPLLFVL